MSETPEPDTAAITPGAETTPAAERTVVIHNDQKPNRLFQVAAWVAIVAGTVFVVAVVFFAGFVMGRHSDDGPFRHHGSFKFERGGHSMMHPGGGPMMHPGGPMMGPGGPMMRPDGPRSQDGPGAPGAGPNSPGAGPNAPGQPPATPPGR